jgi:hypothetical protein
MNIQSIICKGEKLKDVIRDELKVGDKLLWENDTHRKLFGDYSIVSIHRLGDIKGKDYFLKFPDNKTPQYMEFDIIKRFAKLITEQDDPEYFL